MLADADAKVVITDLDLAPGGNGKSTDGLSLAELAIDPARVLRVTELAVITVPSSPKRISYCRITTKPSSKSLKPGALSWPPRKAYRLT